MAEREEGGKRRSKSLRRSAITADSQNPSAFLPLPIATFASRATSFFLFFFLPRPSDARLPLGCSYVHVSYRGTEDVSIDQSPPRLRK